MVYCAKFYLKTFIKLTKFLIDTRKALTIKLLHSCEGLHKITNRTVERKNENIVINNNHSFSISIKDEFCVQAFKNKI